VHLPYLRINASAEKEFPSYPASYPAVVRNKFVLEIASEFSQPIESAGNSSNAERAPLVQTHFLSTFLFERLPPFCRTRPSPGPIDRR
jgi:hypothetical protein